MAKTTKEVVATYADADAARAAIKALERHGVDAERIRLIGTRGVATPTTDAAMREPDMQVTHDVGVRGLATAITLAVLAGAVAFVVVRFVLDGSVMASLGSAVGFFMAGGALGFFYGGASALAVSSEWSDTYQAAGPATISVHVPEEDVIDLREHIEHTHPTRITVA